MRQCQPGHAGADRPAHPDSPWRERTAHPCGAVRFRAIQAPPPGLAVQGRVGRFRTMQSGWLPSWAPGIAPEATVMTAGPIKPSVRGAHGDR